MPPSDDIIELNVGGVPFHTSTSTLCNSRSQGSMLCALACTDLPSFRDRHGRIFIDRDGARFRVVLNFLRNGTVHVVNGLVPCPETGGSVALTALLEEAMFFALAGLERAVREHLDRIELEESLEMMDADSTKQSQESVSVSVSKSDVGSPTSGRQAEKNGVFGKSAPLETVGDYQFTLDAEF
ncbi:unnamed protein product [Chondrus crispus]|uniref:BTB domain-containing protein n=1 Tax=Chondrus crispus TaxID=2769 RepID=R7QF64_CHOCR|nr:unnamed protein product [Chondrus crispus]CDF36045.1 unnamed protein product [Chondrus crispus]|eukprot:XP_005715864.1 unnamed protein product [Chondrus crispus]